MRLPNHILLNGEPYPFRPDGIFGSPWINSALLDPGTRIQASRDPNCFKAVPGTVLEGGFVVFDGYKRKVQPREVMILDYFTRNGNWYTRAQK